MKNTESDVPNFINLLSKKNFLGAKILFNQLDKPGVENILREVKTFKALLLKIKHDDQNLFKTICTKANEVGMLNSCIESSNFGTKHCLEFILDQFNIINKGNTSSLFNENSAYYIFNSIFNNNFEPSESTTNLIKMKLLSDDISVNTLAQFINILSNLNSNAYNSLKSFVNEEILSKAYYSGFKIDNKLMELYKNKTYIDFLQKNNFSKIFLQEEVFKYQRKKVFEFTEIKGVTSLNLCKSILEDYTKANIFNHITNEEISLLLFNRLEEKFIVIPNSEYTIKTLTVAMLLDRLNKLNNIDIKDCYILDGYDNIQKVTKHINKFTAGFKINMILCHDNHFNLLHFEKGINGENNFILFDSVGGGNYYTKINDALKTYINANELDKTYYFVGQNIRQKDKENCAFYTIKDLKTIKQNPELIKQIINNHTKNPLNKSDDVYKFLLPKEFMKMTQSITELKSYIQIALNNGVISSEESEKLIDSVTKHRKHGGFETPEKINNNQIKVNVPEYFRQKYKHECAEIIKKNDNSEILINLIDYYINKPDQNFVNIAGENSDIENNIHNVTEYKNIDLFN